MSRLLQTLKPFTAFVRTKGYKHPGGIKYPGGITYYPRFPNETDPDYSPTKLFRVERIKPLHGNPYWLKKILKELHIDTEKTKVTIVKNIPEINARLWKVKHLVRITPITFPYGEPTSQDINYTLLKESGECIVTKKIEIAPERIAARQEFNQNAIRMDAETIKKDSRQKWLTPYNGGF